ncbi:MAG: carboxypeptidase-like regulatory domain-containing protein [Bacteroidota bacterium]
MKWSFTLILGLIMLPSWLLAQDQPRPQRVQVYQISGMVISKTSMKPVPYARIRINHSRNGALSNADGFYSLPVTEDDTLNFSHLGFHASSLIVKDYLEDYRGNKQYLYAINYMLEDSFTLDTVMIFPYDTPEELRTAVLNLDIYDNSAEAAARENMDPVTLDALMKSLPIDGGERIAVARQMYYDYYQNRNLLPTAGLDPIAITRLLQYVVNRSQKKKNKDLNYWEN